MQADARRSATNRLLTAASLIAVPFVAALLPGSAAAAPSAPAPAFQCPGFPPAAPPPHGGGPRGPGSGPVTPGAPSGWSPSPTSPSAGGPSTPRPAGPAPSHPTSPGGGIPSPAGAPSTGGPGPASPGGGSPTPGPSPTTPSPTSPSSNGAAAFWALQPDTSSWERWWELNRHHFLDLRAHTFVGQPLTADDDFSIGIGERRAGARDLSPTEEQIREGVVPALLQVLADDPSDETINSILVALGRIGEASDAQPGDASLATVLTGYLDHPSHVVNERATIALGVLGDASAAPTLAALARDTDMGRLLVERRSVPERMRAFAAYGLGLTAERSPVPDLRRFAIHHLVGLAEDDDAPRESRVAAILALGLARPQEQALSAPQEDQPPTSSAAALAVWLLDFMDSREGDALRSQVPYALARLVPALGREQRNGIQRRLVRALERRSNEPNGMRRASALALGRIADSDEDDLDRDARRQLMVATEKGDLGTRHFAYVALAQVSGRAGDGEGAPLAGAEEARRFLRNELRRGSSQSRPWVALSLGLLGDSLLDEHAPLAREDVDAMRDQLEDANSPATLGASSIGMGLCRYLNASDVLLEKLEEASDPTVRQHVALALGLNGSHDAIGELRELMLDSYHRPQVLEPAAMALALLDHEPLVDEILSLEEECDCDVSRATIASALGYVGNHRAIEPLIAMLTDEDAHSRLVAMAADSLGRLADKEPRPFSLRLGGDLNYHEAPGSLTDAWGWGILDLD